MQERKPNSRRGDVIRDKDSKNGKVVHRNSITGSFVDRKMDRDGALKILKSKDLIERQVASLDRTE